MQLRKISEQGQMLPKFYGASYFDWEKNYYVCYPLGLNKVISLYRNIIIWSQGPVKFSTNYEKLAATYKRMDKNWSIHYHRTDARLNEAERLLRKFNPDPRIIQWTQTEIDVKTYFDKYDTQNPIK